MKLSGSLLADNNIIEAENSKQALEKLLGKKVKRCHAKYDGYAEYSVVQGNEHGQIYGDHRKWVYYKIL